MASSSWNSGSSRGSGLFQACDPLISQSEGGGALVLDSEKRELVKAPARAVKKGVSEEKTLAALKSHSEAERRRRQRINAHLSTLRGFVPCTEKMDKASLLAEVVQQVKELKKNAAEASKGLLLPTEVDEVRVVPHDEHRAGDGAYSYFMASVCCDYSPRLLSDIRQALDTLSVTTVKAEICSLGGRMRSEFIFTGRQKQKIDDSEAVRLLAGSVHQALSSVLDRASATREFSPRTPNSPNKRRRVSFFDSSSSSS